MSSLYTICVLSIGNKNKSMLKQCLWQFTINYTGGLIGTLPTEQHDVSGEFYVVNSTTIHFEDFNYDGGGPGELDTLSPWSYGAMARKEVKGG